jgi:Tfp pilus assembly protein PilN
MININLLPDEKRRRRKHGGILPAGFVLPREAIIGLIGGFLVLLALCHFVLEVIILVKYVQLKGQQSRWEKVLPEKKEVDDVIKELRDRQARIKIIENVKGSMDVMWAQKLQTISEDLFRGVWLRHLSLEEGVLLLNGSSVSKHKVEMINVHNFLKKLKEDPVFMKGVATVELESIKSRQIGEASVADFIVRVVLEEISQEKE